MKFPLPAVRSGAAFVVAVSLLIVPLWAQRSAPKPAPASTTPTPQTAAADRSPSVTFDTLLSADAYGIYAEMRMVGQHAGSEEWEQLLAPLRLEGSGTPDEFLALHDFVESHADALMTSRLMFATMPVRIGLPEMLLAVEMPSVEEARKFVPELRKFVAANVAPPVVAPDSTGTTKISTAPDPADTTRRRGRRRARATTENAGDATRAKQPAAPQFQIKRAGSLIAMSNANFTFKELHGTDQALLFNEPGFQAARARLGTDTLFVYFNTVRMANSAKVRMEAYEKEHQRQIELAEAEVRKRGASSNSNMIDGGEMVGGAAGNFNTSGNTNANFSVTMGGNMNASNTNIATTPEGGMPPTPDASPDASPTPKSEKELEEERQHEQSRRLVDELTAFALGGRVMGETWTESIGVGASLEGDSLVVRGLFISQSAEQPLRPIPFLPVLLSGPSIAAGAPAVLPADTDIFLTVSLDLPQMYDYLASLMKIADLAPSDEDGRGKFGDQLMAFEKANNFRIREELIAALGNEIAVGIPGNQFFGSRLGRRRANDSEKPAPTGPIVVIALNDKESLQKLLPRVLNAVGFSGATEQSIVEKHGEVEVLNFSNGTLAFIDRFLVGTPDAATMRGVVDAYNSGETLANNERFRDSTSWQSRQAVAQLYLANAMLKRMFEEVIKSSADIDDPAIRAYLARLNPEPGSVTHLATRESNGLMHELRLPKNLLSLLTASQLTTQKLSTIRNNEFMAQWKLRQILTAQDLHKEKTGRYGTLEELIAGGHFSDGLYAGLPDNPDAPLETAGYDVKLSVSGDRFEATATPTGYPKLGRRSFYMDQTGSLRGGDTGGKPASASTPIIE